MICQANSRRVPIDRKLGYNESQIYLNILFARGRFSEIFRMISPLPPMTLGFPPGSGGVGSEHYAANLTIPSMAIRASAGVRWLRAE